MSQLEMVFLMKVSLHLNTMKDVIEFEKVNKKCSTTIRSLKVNPWFNNKEDIEKFNKIFEPTTCNCNGFEIDNSILLKAERIRNYLFGKFSYRINVFCDKKEKQIIEDDNLTLIIQKVESIKTNKSRNGEIEVLIQNMKPNLKIECDELFFIEFEQTFRKLQIEMNFYPKQIIINMDGRNVKEVFELFQESNQDKIICVFNKRSSNAGCRELLISTKVRIYTTFIDLEIWEKNKNIVLMLDFEENNGFPVPINDIVDKENRKIYFDSINKMYCRTVNVDTESMYVSSECKKALFSEGKIRLPECVKEIVNFPFLNNDHINHSNHILPFSLEGIEVLIQNGNLEISEKNDLKAIKLTSVEGINYCERKEIDLNKKTEWGNKNTIDYFPKLTEFCLFECENIEVLNNLQKLQVLRLYKCNSCDINIDSMNLIDIYLNCDNSKFKIKLYRNDLQFFISNSSSVNIKIECEEGIKPSIKIKKCRKLKIKSNNKMGYILIEESNNISFNEGFKCDLIKLDNSETTKGFITAKVVQLFRVLKTCSINLNKAKEIAIVNMNNYIFKNISESCKCIIIDECNGCEFVLGNNQIEKMNVLKCKSTNIEGTLPNIKLFVSIGNIDCKLPITDNTITTDEEIIELKENMKIVTTNKHLIIRNGKDVDCEIESMIKSDITFENCRNIGVKIHNKLIGVLEFINCDLFKKRSEFVNTLIHYGSVDSLIAINSKNLKVDVKSVNKMLKIKDSDLNLFGDSDYTTVDNIEIENSKLLSLRSISSKKCVITNSKTDLSKIVNHCKEELVLKKEELGYFDINKQVKKITFEDCLKLHCNGDLKGKEVKLIRCTDIKLTDTSNSIQMESCENIEVDNQTESP